jgi:DNA-binding LacI/PurR family transcriptional regulator
LIFPGLRGYISHLMTPPTPSPKKPLHEVLASTLSTEILAHLQPGARLASEAELARRFRVSVLTLRQALSVLAHAGMIERRHGSGTYVSDHQQRKGVAIGTVSHRGQNSNAFQTRLFLLLSELFRREGYRCRSYVAPLGFLEGWAELAEDVEYGRVAGAAFVAMNAESIEVPFAEKSVPFVGGASGVSVVLDYADLARRGVRHLAEQGCRKIALMQWAASGPPTSTAYTAFRAAMRDCDLPIRPEWIRQCEPPETSGTGWRNFREIWSARGDEKPDGLLVTDDFLFHEAAMAILDAHIDMPRQLRIVTHANKGSGLTYPFPVSRLEVDVHEWAETIVRQLIASMNDEQVGARVHKIRARLIPAGPSHPLSEAAESETEITSRSGARSWHAPSRRKSTASVQV